MSSVFSFKMYQKRPSLRSPFLQSGTCAPLIIVVTCIRVFFLYFTTERCSAARLAYLFGTHNNINKQANPSISHTQPHSLRAGKNERFKFYQARRRWARCGRVWTGLVSRSRWLGLSLPSNRPQPTFCPVWPLLCWLARLALYINHHTRGALTFSLYSRARACVCRGRASRRQGQPRQTGCDPRRSLRSLKKALLVTAHIQSICPRAQLHRSPHPTPCAPTHSQDYLACLLVRRVQGPFARRRLYSSHLGASHRAAQIQPVLHP